MAWSRATPPPPLLSLLLPLPLLPRQSVSFQGRWWKVRRRRRGVVRGDAKAAALLPQYVAP